MIVIGCLFAACAKKQASPEPSSAVAAEYRIVPRSASPDGRRALAVRPSPANKDADEIVFFDIRQNQPIGEDLSAGSIFNIIALAQRDPSCGARYEVVWAPDSRRVAVDAGFHQFADVEAYEMRDGQPIALPVPDLAPQWQEIERRIAPFQSTKRWKARPAWKTPAQLQFIMGGSAYRNGGATERDFLDFAFRVTLNFNASGEGQVTGLEDTE